MDFLLNDKLRYLRINRGLTQVDLGNYLNMTRQGYAHYENGLRSPNYQILVKLANLYQVSVDDLVDSKEIPLEIVHLYETSPYQIKKEYNYEKSPKNISIMVNKREKELIHMFRKLNTQDKNMLYYKLKAKTQE
ncbi:MAG TPA: helix-turn-helix domain-containing protein [Clostridiales bacterium]|nr:helix-turn-helix domain-containing protein [Clostridiales bacterium]